MATRKDDGGGDEGATSDAALLARVDERQRDFARRLDATDAEVARARQSVHDLRERWTPALSRAGDFPKLEERVTALERNESSMRVRFAVVSAVGSAAGTFVVMVAAGLVLWLVKGG